MKSTLLLVVLALILPTHAEDPKPQSGKDAKGALADILKKLDKDGDGKISDSEKEALHAKVKKDVLDRYDADKDGKLSDDEKAVMKAAMKKKFDKDGKGFTELEAKTKAELTKRYDKDGDGKLNEEEKKNALAAMKKIKEKADPKSAKETSPPTAVPEPEPSQKTKP